EIGRSEYFALNCVCKAVRQASRIHISTGSNTLIVDAIANRGDRSRVVDRRNVPIHRTQETMGDVAGIYICAHGVVTTVDRVGVGRICAAGIETGNRPSRAANRDVTFLDRGLMGKPTAHKIACLVDSENAGGYVALDANVVLLVVPVRVGE